MAGPSGGSSPWLVTFKGRNRTGPEDLNFLWKAGNVYVMDNHRAAAWCWAQEIRDPVEHGLFHIDRHTDALESELDIWLSKLPNGLNMGIADYLDLSYPWNGPTPGTQLKVFRWDTYLPIYQALNSGRVSPLLFATHREGDLPSQRPDAEIPPWALIEEIEYAVGRAAVPWIMNIDLDYFFCNQDDDCFRLFSDDYVDRLAEAVARLNDAGKLAVVTIALTATPHFTDGWPQTEALATRFCAALGHSFKLP